MPIQKEKYNCSGCTACSNICPVSCISMQEDALGFKYPVVDYQKCIHCEFCVKTCPFNKEYRTPRNYPIPIAYAAKAKNTDEIKKSQSGAAFALISDAIIEKGEVVYGVGYTGKFRITTKRAITKEEKDEFRGSKYVQSDLGNIFKEVKQDLSMGRKVLFSGTPCQIAGLTSYLPESLKHNLITIDLVCHGVSGPKVWEDYVLYLENKNRAQIESVNFRDKSLKGWHSHVESFKFAGKQRTYTYTYRFYNHINLRQSCGNCPFTNLRRTGDITIGDCWGIENTTAAYLGEDNIGCSLILINTDCGNELFNAVKSQFEFQKVNINELLQPQLQSPVKLNPLRTKFEEDYAKFGFKYVMRVYGPPRITYIKNFIKRLLPTVLINLIIKIRR